MTSNKPLYKYQGAGNDFVLIEADSSLVLDSLKVSQICERHHGLGADGILQVEELSSDPSLWRMRIYNSDGKLAKMCGNGLRCVAAHVWKKKGASHPFTIQSDAGLHEVLPASSMSSSDGFYYVKTCLGKAIAPWKTAQIQLDLKESKQWLDPSNVKGCFFLNTGVPHLFFLVESDIEDLRSLGSYWRYHPLFMPEGTNVSVGFLKQDKRLHMRTYERGVEDVTFACGTGAVAASASFLTYQQIEGSEAMEVEFPAQPIMNIERDVQDHFWLSGPAAFIFETHSYTPHL